MKYLHTMIRVTELDQTLHFFCDLLGMAEIRRREDGQNKYTNIFLAANDDAKAAQESDRPLLELTYNWPDDDGNIKTLTDGRNFGHLAYRVENIYETCQKLMVAGVTINRPPRDGRMAFVKAPNNISLELLQDGDSLPSQEPWISMENSGSW